MLKTVQAARLLVLTALALPGSAGMATAESLTQDDVIKFVDKAVAYVDEVGIDKAFAAFSDTKGPWVQGELYIFCHSLDGINKAHGGNPGLIGKNVMTFKDPDGVLVNVKILDMIKSEGKGWVNYKWPNSTTKKVEVKYVYAVKINDIYTCGSGYYKS